MSSALESVNPFLLCEVRLFLEVHYQCLNERGTLQELLNFDECFQYANGICFLHHFLPISLFSTFSKTVVLTSMDRN